MITLRELEILRRFFPVTTGLQAVHTLLRHPETRAFCDNWEKPCVVAVTRTDDLVLAGDADADGWIEFVKPLDFTGFVIASADFLPGLRLIDPAVKVWPRRSFTLDGMLKNCPYPAWAKVRKVRPTDASALEEIGQSWIWKYWRSTEDFCANGTARVCEANGRAVSIASIFTESELYVDPAVATHPDHLGRGLATAAAHALCKEILAGGKRPVWNTSVENIPSASVARRLGFREIPTDAYFVMKRDIPDMILSPNRGE
ncbi:MAG: GNAT family N-acetyltransferase [Calditrichaeota bacterium]|nr:GNAT family N-acetyltransferase [Calditrichota bacterium]